MDRWRVEGGEPEFSHPFFTRDRESVCSPHSRFHLAPAWIRMRWQQYVLSTSSHAQHQTKAGPLTILSVAGYVLSIGEQCQPCATTITT